MEMDVNEIEINGIKYLRKDSVPQNEEMSKDYFIVRTYSAGVFAGNIESRNGQEVVMTNARRIWYWSGAASLSQMAMEGVKDPTSCKFAMSVDRVELFQVIEILLCTKKAKENISGVPIWKR